MALMGIMEFQDQMKRLVYLIDKPLKTQAVDFFYEELERFDADGIRKGFEYLIENPPAKLTLRVLKDAIRKYITVVERERVQCDYCEDGHIYTKEEHFGMLYEYTWRCPKCKQSPYIIIPFYNGPLQPITEL